MRQLPKVRAGFGPHGNCCEDGRKGGVERHNTLAAKLLPAGRMDRISDGFRPNLITRHTGLSFLAFLGFSDSGRDIGDWALLISPAVKYERRVQHCAKKFLLRLVKEVPSGLMVCALIGCYTLVGRIQERREFQTCMIFSARPCTRVRLKELGLLWLDQ